MEKLGLCKPPAPYVPVLELPPEPPRPVVVKLADLILAGDFVATSTPNGPVYRFAKAQSLEARAYFMFSPHIGEGLTIFVGSDTLKLSRVEQDCIMGARKSYLEAEQAKAIARVMEYKAEGATA